ncbi:unnamed protein product, partial [Symbiodinium sp. KB8]
VRTSAEGDKDKTEDSLVEAARDGKLNKVTWRNSGIGAKGFALHAFVLREISKVKELLAYGCDPRAWVSGHETFANRALAADGKSRGFIPRTRAADGKSSGTRPLIAAAVSGHSHVVWELLQSRADLNDRDSDGLTALSAAFCSPNCDIHMWFLLHHAVDQERQKLSQSSGAQADIRNDDEQPLHKLQNTQADIGEDQGPNQSSDAREDFPEEEKRTLHMHSNAGADIREDEFLRKLCDGNMNAKTMAGIRADEKRTLRMLVTLLRGEGQIFTEMVAGLLKEVEPGRYRSERLKERMRTVLCDYALVTGYRATKLFNSRGRHTATHFQFRSFAGRSHLAPDTQVQKFLEDRGRSSGRKSMYVLADDRAKKPEDVDAFNLSWHNMLYAPEVQVSLRSLPIAAPLACEPSVLAALAETANEDTLQTDAVEAITAAAWLQMRVATAVDNFLNCVALGCLCLVTWACRKEDMDAQPVPALWGLAIIQFKEAVELLWQLVVYCWSRVSRVRNISKNFQSCGRVHVDRVNGKQTKLLGDVDLFFVQPAPSLETLVDVLFLVAGFFAIYGQMDRCIDGELEPIFLPGFYRPVC